MSRDIGFDHNHTIPSDSSARKVVYADGEHYDPKVKCNAMCFSTDPLPIRDLQCVPFKVLNDPNFKNFTGYKFGRFEVLGLFKCDKFNKWVVRCVCGNQEIRTASCLNRNPKEMDQIMCLACADLIRIRFKDYRKRNGIYPWKNPAKIYDEEKKKRVMENINFKKRVKSD